MGRKGTSKRKPKKNKQIVTANVSGNSPVQAPIQNENTKASGGWNKKKKKR
jgi:hypothetical protein